VTSLYDAHMAELGLKNSQYSLLTAVVKLGPIQPTRLAEVLEMDVSTLSRNLRPLVLRQWLRIEAGPDARSRLVIATEEGQRLRAEAAKRWKAAQLEVNHILGFSEVAHLHDLIDACMQRLHAATSAKEVAP
jgi:DNA-binding MarR family transcriptional regulator